MQPFIRRCAPYLGACAITFALVAPLAGAAQDDPSAQPAAGAGGTGVARVSVIDGSVALQRGDSSDSLAAAVNAPVLGGDYITTGDVSRAEIEIDGYAQVRLGQDVQMRFTRLDPANRSVQLAVGTIDVRLSHGTDGATAIDTPSITIEPQRSGSYRVSVTSDGRTLVSVRSGDARVDTPQGSQDVRPGGTLVATGPAANPTVQLEFPLAYDDFDRFNAARDHAYAYAAADSAYVNPDLGGVADLASNGSWVEDGSYGHVWIPAGVGPQWVPYRDGRWVWEDGYGWTWVAAESWGWAPYHYGSWYHSPNYGWCWYPPRPNVVVPWRPALVAFIGFGLGGGFSLGFGGGNTFGNIGWVPLAPFEAYHPWWGNRYGDRGGTTVKNVTNITNITNVTNVTNTINTYRNVRQNAVSSVSSQRFLQGNFTRNVAVAQASLHQAQVFHGAVPLVPTASNLRFSNNSAPSPIAVRSALLDHRFAGKTIEVRRTPFTEQRIALAMATHAALTPLHFKDVQSTPRSEQQASNRIRGTTAMASIKAAPANVAMPILRSASPPAPAGASTDAWARFPATRAPDGTATRGNAVPRGKTPAIVDDRTHSATALDRTQPAGSAYAHAPSYSNAYHAPANPNVYHAPANPNVYHAPANPNVYHAPANPNIDHTPANPNIDHTPANINVYHTPGHSETNRAPLQEPTAPAHGALSLHGQKPAASRDDHAQAHR